MTQLLQTASSIGNCTALTIATWFKVLSYGDGPEHYNHPMTGMNSIAGGNNHFDIFSIGYQINFDSTTAGTFDDSWTALSVRPRGTPLSNSPGDSPASVASFQFGVVGSYHAPIDLGGGILASYYGLTAYPRVVITLGNEPSQPLFDVNDQGWHLVVFSMSLDAPDTLVLGTLTQGTRVGIIFDGILFRPNSQFGGGTFIPTAADGAVFPCSYNLKSLPSPDSGDDPTISKLDSIVVAGGELGVPTIDGQNPDWSPWINKNHGPELAFANTQMWFGTYVELGTSTNRDKFFQTRDGSIYPPDDIHAAQTAFGPSDIWFARDNISGIKFEENQGSGGDFDVVGTPPEDILPGPEEGVPL